MRLNAVALPDSGPTVVIDICRVETIFVCVFVCPCELI